MLYLDNNATTRPSPQVVQAITATLTDHWHNPSSVHRPGQAARQKIELARQSLASLIGARPRSITLTSGGTESINLAIRGCLDATGKAAVVSSPVEHAAVRDLLDWLKKRHAVDVRLADVDHRGVVSLDSLARLLDDRVALVSLQWANNETGVIQPVHEVARLCRERHVPFHCDATQWVGKMETVVGDAPGALDADLLTFSPHKFHGPKGVGVLYARAGARVAPQILGSQEKGRRGGTENVAGIIGAGVAADLAREWLADTSPRRRLAAMRDRFEADVLERIPTAQVNGADADRLWNTTNIAFPRLEAEALLLLLSERGLCASAGAACSSGSLDPSPVLLAMSIPPELAHGSLRFSLSRETTEEELAAAIPIISECVARLSTSMR